MVAVTTIFRRGIFFILFLLLDVLYDRNYAIYTIFPYINMGVTIFYILKADIVTFTE